MAMQKEDQDKLAEKLAELGRHAQRQKELTTEAQATADHIVTTYTWIAGKLASAQLHQVNVIRDIAASQAGPPSPS
jgi:hypothetical protein